MATIQKRTGKSGNVTYQAKIRRKLKGKIIHQESKTFNKKKNAELWIRNREAALDNPNELDRIKHIGITVGQVLKVYQEEFDTIKQAGRSKNSELKRLQNTNISELDAIQLTSADIITHLMNRLEIDRVKPQTANNDAVYLRVAFKSVKAKKNWPLAIEAIENAIIIAKNEKLIARSDTRERRPTSNELVKLDNYFKIKDLNSSIPMREIMWFAIHSSRRQEEITRIEWNDNDDQAQTGLVRNLKHPRTKRGNHKRFKYTNAAWEVMQQQDKKNKFIFPFNPATISSKFTDACKILEISDLHFHDLRHEATSRCFEAGHSIQEVQLITLHDSWVVLKRYTHLRPEEITAKL
ncbi:tyrosine-type recombinase/integrase [Psychromonas sp. MME1]|uniref:tyrosine-type recombinase/integrase n=1 Tax=Psychromonas sp. MME1 TaxID=3231032 RepID=UPI0034E1AB1B